MTSGVDLLMSGGSTSAQWPKIGHSYAGTIIAIGEARQQTDPKDQKPKTFADGTPRMQTPVTLATDTRGKFEYDEDEEKWTEVEIPDDDGIRTLYVAADMQRAIRDAVLKAFKGSGDKPRPEIGGHLTVTRGKNKPKKPGMKAQHTFAAEYIRAADNANADAVMDDQDPFND